MAGPTLSLLDVRASGPEIVVTWSVDRYVFTTTYWYDFDLDELHALLDGAQFDRVLFHIALFEINKGASLRPERLDLGRWTPLLTPELAELWQTVLYNVWAQWRWEHDDPWYQGPALPPTTARPEMVTPVSRAVDAGSALVFCGGGKDSLVALDLLERAGVPYSSFVYSSSTYGRAAEQHRLVGDLLRKATPQRVHRQWIYDDFADTPILDMWDATPARSLTAAETPSSLFASLPVVLRHGYQHVVLAHERSANTGNVVWDVTGEDVNHQWGKSLAAEQLLDTYVRNHLVPDFSYFSILQPVHDPVIFSMLRRRLDAVPLTHSCNVRKPWCRRCPKCAYVWINYKAWLPWPTFEPLFDGENLLDVPENQLYFEQMLGLHDHTPFECIGQIAETQLAFAMARARGLTGVAMETFSSRVRARDWVAVADPLLAVADDHRIPAPLAGPVLGLMRDAADDARRYIGSMLAA
jgi:hypothetical protein